MLDAATVVDLALDHEDEAWVTSMTTNRVPMGTRLAVSLHRRNTAEDKTGMTEICVTSSATEMHAAELKTSVKSASALNRSSVKK
jgi:hypothetical protein